MNDDLIFFKTPTGEDAMRERTRLVQRNLRMVLIPVDGQANVAALKQSVGDAAMVEASLTELERMGLIESAEAHAARLDRVREQAEAPEVVPEATAAEPTSRMEQPWVSLASGEAAAVEPTVAVEDGSTTIAASSLLKRIAETGLARETKDADTSDETVFDFGDGDISHAAIEPTAATLGETERTTSARRLKIGIKPLVVGIGVVLLAALGWQLFIRSYDIYRPDFERALSGIVDDSVTVGKVRVVRLPAPAILLEDVKVGAPAYASIAVVRLASEPWDFIGNRHHIRRAAIEGMRIADVDIMRVAKWFSAARMADVRVGHLDIENLTLDLGRGTLTGLAGNVEINADGGLEKILFRSAEGNMQAQFTPAAGGWMASLTANGWRAPVEPAAFFSKLDVQGMLSPGHLKIDQLTSQTCDGLVVGNGTIDWQRTPEMALSLDLQHLSASCLMTTMGSPALLDGEANASVVVAASAPSLEGLAKAWRLEGKFGLARGALKRLDLAEALRKRTGGEPVRGGQTPFEELHGTVSVTDRVVRLASLRMDSGLMRASGQATVSRPAATIAGDAHVELRGSAESVRAPLAISGSTADPELKALR